MELDRHFGVPEIKHTVFFVGGFVVFCGLSVSVTEWTYTVISAYLKLNTLSFLSVVLWSFVDYLCRSLSGVRPSVWRT